jgi:hypothetical protein
MTLEALKDQLIELTRTPLDTVKVSPKGDKVGLQLSHGILSKAPRTETYPLAEGANPLGRMKTVTEVLLVIGFKTKTAKLSVALVDLVCSALTCRRLVALG